MKILGGLFGLLLRFCYKLTANYGRSEERRVGKEC